MTLRKKQRKRPAVDLDRQRGLYRKFEVMRTDGSSGPGQKHEHCRYFALDLTHDPHARYAAAAYAESVMFDNPQLANDLMRSIRAAEIEDRVQSGQEIPSRSFDHGKVFCP